MGRSLGKSPAFIDCNFDDSTKFLTLTFADNVNRH